MTIWVYIRSEPGLWTVGFYDPSGEWQPESDWGSTDEAAKRVHYLNGGNEEQPESEGCPLCNGTSLHSVGISTTPMSASNPLDLDTHMRIVLLGHQGNKPGVPHCPNCGKKL